MFIRWFKGKRGTEATTDSIATYEQWMTSAEPLNGIAGFYATSTPGVSYVPSRIADSQVNLDTHSAMQCPDCEAHLTLEQVGDLRMGAAVVCPSSHRINSADATYVAVIPASVPMLDAKHVANMKWFHASTSPTWDEAITSGVEFLAHVGTYDSAKERAFDLAMADNVAHDFYVYEVTITPEVTVDDVVFPDLDENWEAARPYFKGDVTRYLNSHEDAGSISLVVSNLAVLTIRKVATLDFDVYGRITEKMLLPA